MKLIAERAILHDGRSYESGDAIEVNDSDAAQALIDCGAARPADASGPNGSVEEAIGAMLEDDPDQRNPDFWLKDGRPEVKEIERRLGADISAKDRDRAWRAMRQ